MTSLQVKYEPLFTSGIFTDVCAIIVILSELIKRTMMAWLGGVDEVPIRSVGFSSM